MDCKKNIGESGQLKSEMLFENNMKCKGLREITNKGKQKIAPKIQVKHVTILRDSGMYSLDLSLEKKYRNVQFYIGELLNGTCLPINANSVLSELETKNGKATFVFSIPRGDTLSRDIPIVALVKTSYLNYYVLSIKTSVECREIQTKLVF